MLKIVLSISLTLAICIAGGLAGRPQARAQGSNRHEPTIECAAKGGECDESRGRPVCGTDDQTYPSRCHLMRVQCSGHQVSLKYRGPCKACKEARDYALKHKSRSPPKFVPRCKPDGTYAPIQCLYRDTSCWCSDITGKPIENTTVRSGKPKCREFQRANIRRSPARHIQPPSRQGRECTQADRAAFNKNLLKVYQSEYMRAVGQQQSQMQRDLAAQGDAMEKLALDWKFGQLDVNANRVLDKNEFRELKKLVKRAVKPRRCGRVFGKFCDADNDDRLSRAEWYSCMAKDGTNRLHHHQATVAHPQTPPHKLPPSTGYGNRQTNGTPLGPGHDNNVNLNNNNNNNNKHSIFTNHVHHPASSNHNQNHNNNSQNNNNRQPLNRFDDSASTSLGDEDEDAGAVDESSQQFPDYEEYGDEVEDDEDTSMGFINPSVLKPKSDSSPLKEAEGESDCLTDQAAALESGDTQLYVPECTADGRYQRVQCYRSTPYCWCVLEDTGKHIPGTSVKHKKPQCDDIYPVSRPMKGCPEPKKTQFLKDLKQFLSTHFLANTNTGSSNSTNWNSEEERIATLSFVLLDKNKNKSWERKEWKPFREMMTSSKTLRRCGKKMPRYCDANGDKKITLTEWLNCLQAEKAESSTANQSNESVTSKPSKLIGSNPLEQYLKE